MDFHEMHESMTLARSLHPLRDKSMVFKSAIGLLAALFLLVACTPHSIDNETNPDWVNQQHAPHADIALVFVHGVFGDAIGTWTSSETSFFKLLAEDPDIGPKVDMYAFGYTSKMIGEGSLGIDEAANMLYERLLQDGVFEYPAVFFANHSMGGLVTMQMLLSHSELLDQVPGIVLFSTPQSGAEISKIATHVSSNEALRTMTQGDQNAYIRMLNDAWKALDQRRRPKVHCGYEKNKTGPIFVVDWASATRFCDGAALAISSDHIGIVKPTSRKDPAFLVMQNALRPLIGRPLKPRLEVPDFAFDNGEYLITIDNPFGKQDAQIKNTGGGVLRYSLQQWPNGLYVWPGTVERTLGAGQVEMLQIALAWGARSTEYEFVLRSNAADSYRVRVRIKNIEEIRDRQEALAVEALASLNSVLRDPARRSEFESFSPEQANDHVAALIYDVIDRNDSGLTEAGKWTVAASLLVDANWPDFAASALRQAQRVTGATFSVPSVQVLAGNIATLNGKSFDAAEPSSTGFLAEWAVRRRTAFTSERTLSRALKVAEGMERFSVLKSHGLSLKGDVFRASGQPEKATKSYRQLVIEDNSPINESRLKALSGSGQD